jgi:hypothetical protein
VGISVDVHRVSDGSPGAHGESVDDSTGEIDTWFAGNPHRYSVLLRVPRFTRFAALVAPSLSTIRAGE